MDTLFTWSTRLLVTILLGISGYYLNAIDTKVSTNTTEIVQRGPRITLNEFRINKLEEAIVELRQETKEANHILRDIKALLQNRTQH